MSEPLTAEAIHGFCNEHLEDKWHGEGDCRSGQEFPCIEYRLATELLEARATLKAAEALAAAVEALEGKPIIAVEESGECGYCSAPAGHHNADCPYAVVIQRLAAFRRAKGGTG